MIRVDFAFSPAPRDTVILALTLPDGATLNDAVRAAASNPRAECLAQGAWEFGVWGHRKPPGALLQEGDRVEAYRPLKCDPKEARRLRYRQSPAPARRLRPSR